MNSAFEAHNMLRLSTAHIRRSTHTDLEFQTDDVPIAFAKGLYGWFLPVLEPYPDGVPSTCPYDLLALFAFARKLGFTWLMLDNDGPCVEGLETWEW